MALSEELRQLPSASVQVLSFEGVKYPLPWLTHLLSATTPEGQLRFVAGCVPGGRYGPKKAVEIFRHFVVAPVSPPGHSCA